MALRSVRLKGDQVLENCLAGTHRMFAGEDGLSVMRVQSALLDLGRSLGPRGADGTFGPATGAAVTAYKADHGLVPNDPVVGPGTTRALDDELFHDPPELDPVFGEFSPAVVEHRLEQFVARELIALLRAPLDSCRHMLGRFALDALNSGTLLGIVAQSRAIDLRDAYLAIADEEQQDGLTAEEFFDDALTSVDLANTFTYFVEGEPRAFIVISDRVILGRASIFRRSDGTRAPSPLSGVLVHELTHARNLVQIQSLLATDDTDTDAYADTDLAQTLSAAAGPTAGTLRSYVAEIAARHVHWIAVQELAGTPAEIAIRGLAAEDLARAAIFYFVEVPNLYDRNGYGAAIQTQGSAVSFEQLHLWLRLCAAQSFSDISDHDALSTEVFEAAARFCEDQIPNGTLDVAPANGVFPLSQDFH